MITYNHEAYISEAIESVLMQITNFPIDLIIGEDCSTDNTRNICLEYKQKYMSIIKLLLPEKNIGDLKNFMNTYHACKGKYIALLEGDDYWTDPMKLQKQVDYLEANPEYVLCSHRYKQYDETEKKWLPELNSFDEIFQKQNFGYTFNFSSGMIDKWLTKTLTVVFKKNSINFQILDRYKYFRDFHLFYHILNNGKGYYMNFIGGVYRLHDGGIHSKIGYKKRLELSYPLQVEFLFFNKNRLKNSIQLHFLRNILLAQIGLKKKSFKTFVLTLFKHLLYPTQYLAFLKCIYGGILIRRRKI
jgi:glycosyltransferase involved in cell wall biosynthesis